MPMKMGWRWYGEGNDPVTLSDIKQIPGVTSIVWALHNKMPGEIWEIDEIQKVADQIHAYGFDMDVVESVNVHDDIKIGLPTRDKYIENYKQCIRNLSKFGVKTICYNFMPVFDWTRTDLAHVLPDGSDCLSFEEEKVRAVDPERGIELPGWGTNHTPAELQALLHSYRGIGEEELWDNCRYFLRAVLPVAAVVLLLSGDIIPCSWGTVAITGNRCTLLTGFLYIRLLLQSRGRMRWQRLTRRR